jgi:serpin B
MPVMQTPSFARELRAALWLALLVGLAHSTAPGGDLTDLVDASRPNPAAQAVNHLGFGLYRQLRATDDPAENLIISPVSLATATSLLGAGAGGDTAAEFGRVLRGAADESARDAAFGRLLASLDPRVDESDPAGGPLPEWPVLTIATRLWVSERITILDGFRRTARGQYRAEVAVLDENAPQATSDAINAWVADATAGRIPRIIDAVTVGNSSVLLVNAVGLKAGWARQFRPEQTATKPFHVAPRETVEVPMMRQEERLYYRRIEEPGFAVEILELPYTGPFRMLILLPQGDTPLPAVEDRLTPEVWQAWSADIFKRNVTVWLPRFRIQGSGIDLLPLLRDLGLASLADDARADFSRLASQRLAVNLFRHSAMIAVDEKGTEAAAVTDTGMREVSAIDAPPVEFRADRPLVFVIDDPSPRERSCFSADSPGPEEAGCGRAGRESLRESTCGPPPASNCLMPPG